MHHCTWRAHQSCHGASPLLLQNETAKQVNASISASAPQCATITMPTTIGVCALLNRLDLRASIEIASNRLFAGWPVEQRDTHAPLERRTFTFPDLVHRKSKHSQTLLHGLECISLGENLDMTQSWSTVNLFTDSTVIYDFHRKTGVEIHHVLAVIGI